MFKVPRTIKRCWVIFICSTLGPLSNTNVFNPPSVSSLAAQPPLIPEPTTIVSGVFYFVCHNPNYLVAHAFD
jgi:hypothetical protein